MSLSELFGAPSPDGNTGSATARADALAADPSLGGATRTNADAGSTLDNLLIAVGKAVRGAVVGELAQTPAGQAAIRDAQSAYLQQQWLRFGPILVLGLLGVIAFLFVRR